MRLQRIIILIILLAGPITVSNAINQSPTTEIGPMPEDGEPEYNTTFSVNHEFYDGDGEEDGYDSIEIDVTITNPDSELIEIKLVVHIKEGDGWELVYDEWKETANSEDQSFDYSVRWDGFYNFTLYYYVNDHEFDHDGIAENVEMDGYSQVWEWDYEFYPIHYDDGLDLLEDEPEEHVCYDAFEVDVVIVYDDLTTSFTASLDIYKVVGEEDEDLVAHFNQSEEVEASGTVEFNFNKYEPEEPGNYLIVIRVIEGDDVFGDEEVLYTQCEDVSVFETHHELYDKDDDGLTDTIKIEVNVAYVEIESPLKVNITITPKSEDDVDPVVVLTDMKDLAGTGEASFEFWYNFEAPGIFVISAIIKSLHDTAKAVSEDDEEFEVTIGGRYENDKVDFSFDKTENDAGIQTLHAKAVLSGFVEEVSVLFKIGKFDGDEFQYFDSREDVVAANDETTVSYSYNVDDKGKYIIKVKVFRGDEVFKEGEEDWQVEIPDDTSTSDTNAFIQFSNLQYSVSDEDGDECDDTFHVAGEYEWVEYSGTVTVKFFVVAIIDGEEFSETNLLNVDIEITNSGSDTFDESISLPVGGSAKIEVIVVDANNNVLIEGDEEFEGLCAFVGDGSNTPDSPLPISPMYFIFTSLLLATQVIKRKLD